MIQKQLHFIFDEQPWVIAYIALTASVAATVVSREPRLIEQYDVDASTTAAVLILVATLFLLVSVGNFIRTVRRRRRMRAQ